MRVCEFILNCYWTWLHYDQNAKRYEVSQTEYMEVGVKVVTGYTADWFLLKCSEYFTNIVYIEVMYNLKQAICQSGLIWYH